MSPHLPLTPALPPLFRGLQRTWTRAIPALLGPSAPLAMPQQDFGKKPARLWPKQRGAWIPRAALFFGAALMTAAFAHELYGVLSFVQVTPIQLLFLVLSTLSFGWIAVGTLSAAMGFLPLFAGEKADNIDIPTADGPLSQRTALLFPVYHEDPARIAGTIAAIAEELEAMGKASAFDVYVLSDTRGADVGAAEEAAYAELKRVLAGQVQLYYRRRAENTGRKAGNIKDWVERFGAAYEFFVILDGDSIMSGTTLVRLGRAMEATPSAGLIQTVPQLTGGVTLLQRLMQFASNIYGPAVSAGLAVWSRDQGNYWGHNAIIRTVAFAGSAGLPDLPGKAPFGGHIMSHDFVEAVLLERAGWRVHMAPTLDGSYEGMPPRLIDLIVRDRRWSQGNLQHLAIVGAPGISAMGRLHLGMGALAYIVSAIWAGSLLVGVVLALQGQQMLPSYFTDSKTLFPIWPVIDPGAAMRLFLATMAVVLLPKVLGLALEIKRSSRARELFGMPRAVAAVVDRDAVLDAARAHHDDDADDLRRADLSRPRCRLEGAEPRWRRVHDGRCSSLPLAPHADGRRDGIPLLGGLARSSRLDVTGVAGPHPVRTHQLVDGSARRPGHVGDPVDVLSTARRHPSCCAHCAIRDFGGSVWRRFRRPRPAPIRQLPSSRLPELRLSGPVHRRP